MGLRPDEKNRDAERMVLESRAGTSMTFKVVLEPSEEGGYTAHVPSLPGCISEGETVEEAMANIREAVELYLEPVEDDLVLPEGAVVREMAL